jgi:DNA-binding NtrC family response regulator
MRSADVRSCRAADTSGMSSDVPNAQTVPAPVTRVLVVDADRRVRASLDCLIEVAEGVTCVSCVADTTGAMAVLEREPVDALLIDPRLPDAEVGLSFLGAVRRRWPDVSIVAMSGLDDLVQYPLLNGAITFVAKTGQPDDLLAALTRRPPQAGIV